MSQFLITCEGCNREATLTQPGRYCSSRCRARHHAQKLIARRRELAAEAAAALELGDVAKLEAVARRTVDLLAA